MIDGVERQVFDQVVDVGVLDRGYAVLGEQRCHPGDEVVGVGRVRENVVGDDRVGLPPLAPQPLRKPRAEELLQGRHAGRLGRLGLRGRRVDAEHRHVELEEVVEEVAVVRGDLDHEAVLAEPEELLGEAERLLARVPKQVVGERREVEVVVDEQPLRRHGLEDLDERARRADRQLEWVARLRPVGAVLAQQRVGQRQLAEPQEDLERSRAAGAAVRAVSRRQARGPGGAGPRRARLAACKSFTRWIRKRRPLVNSSRASPKRWKAS